MRNNLCISLYCPPSCMRRTVILKGQTAFSAPLHLGKQISKPSVLTSFPCGCIFRPAVHQPTSCGDYTKLCTADLAHQKPGRNTWPRRLQTSVPHDYSRSPTSTSTANVCIMVYVDDLLFIGEPRRLHASSRRYKPRCYCDTEALVQQARQSTPSVDELQAKESTVKFHSTTATPTTYYKKPTYSKQRRQLHQEQQQEQQLPLQQERKKSYIPD